ncbi:MULTISPECIES: hypothetical protein [Alphaproteobacteria]|jgi:hypothetical protein|uniref:Uncharacterized protein n=1 Tax=Maricaulis virginensis TaxID=144022 RepID=A0A9W6IPB4_9PROT|nr:hypothetical protein [Maricaulis virginensis]GLK53956.1 hypothetical protein GCM10017621_34640 [Maricaulis virginensis]
MREIEFESMATSERATFPRSELRPEIAALLAGCVKHGQIELANQNVSVVFERPHAADDPGEIINGALV